MRCGAHVSFDPGRRGHRGVHSSGWRLAGLMVWLCVSRWPAVGMRRSGCLGQRALHSCELYRARTCRHAPARLAFALMQCADVCAARRSLVRRASAVTRSRSPLPAADGPLVLLRRRRPSGFREGEIGARAGRAVSPPLVLAPYQKHVEGRGRGLPHRTPSPRRRRRRDPARQESSENFNRAERHWGVGISVTTSPGTGASTPRA